MKSIALAIVGLCTARASIADDAACKVALDAVTRVLATPNHQFMTRSDAGGTGERQSEIINTGIAMYVQVNGKWRTSPVSPQSMQDIIVESQKKARATSCRLVRNESIAGTSAGVYTVHNETDSGISDSILWISKADGLPLKQEVDMTVGNAPGKSHSEVRFVYTDVKAPAGVE